MQNKKTITNKFKRLSPILLPNATVFISGFCIMVLELSAGRIIARELGSSIYTWTAVIGVILAGITVGNYLGGRIADKFDAKNALAALFAVSSALCILTIILNNTVGEWLWLWYSAWPRHVLIHVSLMFLLPSTLLGTISPVVAKMALDRGLPKGRTVGDIYAWGAAGSIAGTFAAGYYLIAAIGSVAVIWAISGVLALLAVLYRASFMPLQLWMALFALIVIVATAPIQWCKTVGAALLLRRQPDPAVLYENESQYCYIAVKQVSKTPDRRKFMEDKLSHSDLIMGDINNLQYIYERICANVTRAMSRNKDNLTVMIIGGGGYVFPRYIENNWPGSRVDVVEIDPAVTEAAFEAFGLDRKSPINTFSMDARNFVDGLLENRRNGLQTPRYDFVYEDALNDYSIPYQLMSREFNEKIAGLLTDDGAYMIELIDIYDSGRFLGTVVNTLQQTFPHVYIATDRSVPPFSRTTFIVLATKRPFDIKTIADEKNLKLWRLNDAEIETLRKKAHGTVLTDDYAPVENMLAPVVRRSGIELLEEKLADNIAKFKQQGKWDDVVKTCKRLIKTDPKASLFAYSEIATSRASQGRTEEVAEALRNAIKYNEAAEYKVNIATVYSALGYVLHQLGQNSEADKNFQKAIAGFNEKLKEDDKSLETWMQLGETLARTGNFKEASNCFDRAVQLDPRNIQIYMKLAQSLNLQGRFDESTAVINKAISVASQAQDTASVAKLKEFQTFLNSQKSKNNN